jgi:hypothetical protein
MTGLTAQLQRVAYAFGIASMSYAWVSPGVDWLPSILGGALIGWGAGGWIQR